MIRGLEFCFIGFKLLRAFVTLFAISPFLFFALRVTRYVFFAISLYPFWRHPPSLLGEGPGLGLQRALS